ncbi:MAG: TldD/PmbA family protein [Phormidesmis sp. RL_2_1]|nr:TldD/PmbA family protein [Phormidesmis sp. RL_2_1]
MPNNLPNNLPEQLLEQAIASGAQVAEVYESRTFSRPVLFEGNRLKQIETTQSEGIALRLWRDGRPGLVVGYGPIAAEVLVEKALAVSTLNPPEMPNLTTASPNGGLPAGQSSQRHFPDMGMTVAVEQLVRWGEGAIARLRDRFPEVICEAEIACDVDYTRLINSTGLDYCSQDTTLSGYITAELVNQDDFLSVSDGVLGRIDSEAASKPGPDQLQLDQQDQAGLDLDKAVNSIIQRLNWAQRTVAPATGQVPIIFTPRAAWLLWETLQLALNGKRVKENISPWSQQWGQQVVAAAITLGQDPSFGPYRCPFDDEGILTRPLVLIEGGHIKNWYCDRVTGEPNTDLTVAGLGLGSTGNGIRPGLGSYPTPGLINLIITPGNHSWEDLIAQQKDAIIVDQVMGEGGDITGDLSVNLDLGYRVSKGEIIGRVKDTMVSGNAYSALNNLVALGCDTDWSGSTYTPSVVVESLSVTG